MVAGQLDFSLLIPCYNNFEGLLTAIRSVRYDREKYLIVVVDDGSDLPVTEDQLARLFTNTHPIIVLRNQGNKGITVALNKGLQWIVENTRSEYIARLDCGDTCHPERFYKQVSVMNSDPALGIIGTWCIFQDSKSSLSYVYKTPTTARQIKKAMHFRNVFIHPTVLFRTSLLTRTGFYPAEFPYTEDYALFWKMILISSSCIIAEFLVTCEINEEGISLKNRSVQLKNRSKVIWRFGTNPLLKTTGTLRVYATRLLPKRLVLLFKRSVFRQ